MQYIEQHLVGQCRQAAQPRGAHARGRVGAVAKQPHLWLHAVRVLHDCGSRVGRLESAERRILQVGNGSRASTAATQAVAAGGQPAAAAAGGERAAVFGSGFLEPGSSLSLAGLWLERMQRRTEQAVGGGLA